LQETERADDVVNDRPKQGTELRGCRQASQPPLEVPVDAVQLERERRDIAGKAGVDQKRACACWPGRAF
jgi:hypothetical protein